MSRRKDSQATRRKELVRQAKRRIDRMSRNGGPPVRLSDEFPPISRSRYSESRESPRFGRLDSRAELYEVDDFDDDQSHSPERAEEILEHRCRREPGNADLALMLAGRYLENGRPNLAHQQFKRSLDRFPQDERAESVRQTLTALDQDLRSSWAGLNLPADKAIACAAMNEAIQAARLRGDPQRACDLGERSLAQCDDFPPVWNNLAEAQVLVGRLDAGIATLQRILRRFPDNAFSRGALARALAIAGRLAEAEELADTFVPGDALSNEAAAKQAEALLLLGRDESALAMLQHRIALRGSERSLGDALLHHFAAVAALRLGRETEARRLWTAALRCDSDLEVARENLADLAQPIGQRHAPWLSDVDNWLPQRGLMMAKRLLGEDPPDEVIESDTIGLILLRAIPSLPKLVTVLLVHGDEFGRYLALSAAKQLDTPQMRQTLLEFALGKAGPDALRQEAVMHLGERGALPARELQLWREGEFRATLVQGYKIDYEPQPPFENRRAHDLYEEAYELLMAGDGRQAEPLLRQALELVQSPQLMHNLACALDLQFKMREANALHHEVVARFPEYVFGQTWLAKFLAVKRDFAGAKAILAPLVERERFHISEFSALCEAMMDAAYAEGEKPVAKYWLDMLEQMEPEHPFVDRWRKRLSRNGLLGSLVNLFS